MLNQILSIPTTVRAGFDVQDLPPRASALSEDSLENISGGRARCRPIDAFCITDGDCCSRKCEGFLSRGCRR